MGPADTPVMRVARPAAAVLAALAVVAAAPAGPALADGCPPEPVSRPYERLGDDKWYFMAPGGTFERAAAPWSLSGSTSWSSSGVASFGGWRSLVLDAAAQATSPSFCVDDARPHLRLGAKATPGSRLRVTAIKGGEHVWLATLRASEHDGWAVSREIPLAPMLNLGGGTASVRLRVKALDGRVWVDAVAVDPFTKR